MHIGVIGIDPQAFAVFLFFLVIHFLPVIDDREVVMHIELLPGDFLIGLQRILFSPALKNISVLKCRAVLHIDDLIDIFDQLLFQA